MSRFYDETAMELKITLIIDTKGGELRINWVDDLIRDIKEAVQNHQIYDNGLVPNIPIKLKRAEWEHINVYE